MFGLSGSYPDLIWRLIAHFAAIGNCELHLVSHVLSYIQAVEDDYRVCQSLRDEPRGVVLPPKFASPFEAKRYISNLDLFCGARMHACIAAFSSGVAVVPMAYSRKFAGLFGTLGYNQTVDCRSENEDEIFEKTIEDSKNRMILKQSVLTALRKADDRLDSYEAKIVEAIQTVAAGKP